jgi:hypothetical protein
MPLQPVDNSLRDVVAFAAGALVTCLLGCLISSCVGGTSNTGVGAAETAQKDERKEDKQEPDNHGSRLSSLKNAVIVFSVENRTRYSVPITWGNVSTNTATMKPYESWDFEVPGTSARFTLDESLEDGIQTRSYAIDRTVLAGGRQDADKGYIQAYRIDSEWRNNHDQLTLVRVSK